MLARCRILQLCLRAADPAGVEVDWCSRAAGSCRCACALQDPARVEVDWCSRAAGSCRCARALQDPARAEVGWRSPGRVPKSDSDWTRTRGHTPGFGPDSESESAGSREPGRTRTRTRTPRSAGRPDSDWTRTPGSRWPAGLLPGLPCVAAICCSRRCNCSLRLPYIYSGLTSPGVYHRVLRCSFTFPSPHYSADCKKKGRGRSSAKRDAKASPQDRKRAATSRSARAARTPLALAGPRCIRSFECTKILSEYETIVPARGLRMMACTIMNDAFMCYY